MLGLSKCFPHGELISVFQSSMYTLKQLLQISAQKAVSEWKIDNQILHYLLVSVSYVQHPSSPVPLILCQFRKQLSSFFF